MWRRLRRLLGGRREFPWAGGVVTDLEVETDGEHDTGCACCDHESRVVWGYVHWPLTNRGRTCAA